MKKLAIFDLDGTILYTLDDLENSLNFALAAHRFPARTHDEVRRFVGNGISKLIERGVPKYATNSQTEEVFTTFMEHYRTHCFDTTRPYDGISGLMGALRRKGLRIAVVSNKADGAVKALCDRFFPTLIDYAVGERSGVKRKPAPDSVFAALDVLCCKPSDGVYVGDSEVDIQTAANAGMDCVSVTWGFKDPDFLLENGAKVLINSPEELLKYID